MTESWWRWVQEIDNWIGVPLLIGLSLLIVYSFNRGSPQYQERAVARRLERRKVADVVSAALQDATARGELTPEQLLKYNKKLAKALGLPDMERQKLDLKRTKRLVTARLHNMGVNVEERLATMRRAPKDKQKYLETKLNKLREKHASKGAH